MRLRYAAVAQAEANDIFSYIAGENPVAATAVATAIKAAIARLHSFPGTGTATTKAGVHVVMAWPYRYLIFYAIRRRYHHNPQYLHPARRRPQRDQ